MACVCGHAIEAPAAVQEAAERLRAVVERLLRGRFEPAPVLRDVDLDLALLLTAAQDGARARVAAIEECARMVEAVAVEHRRDLAEMQERAIAEGGRRHKLCGEEGYFCEDFGCGSFIALAAKIRSLLPPEEAGPR